MRRGGPAVGYSAGALIHVAVLLSGFAGLLWQVVWVRELGLVFGGTTQAVALGTGCFLAGLGVGARLGGAGDRLRHPARIFAGCELFVAAWGIVSWPVLVHLAGTGVGGLEQAANGWWVPTVGARLVVLLLMLGPPTIAMGASLPLLARCVVGDDIAQAGWRIGRLAAVNTLGACIGALASDLLVIPALGLQGTGLVAGACGIGAAALAWGARAGRAAAEVDDGPPTGVPLAAAIAGFAAMGCEVLWFRFLGSALGPYRAVFSLLVGTLLGGWMLGAIGAAVLTRRFPDRVATLYTVVQTLVGGLILAGLLAHDAERLLRDQIASVDADRARLLAVNLRAIAIVVLPAAIAMGAAFPLGTALLQRNPGRVSREAGRLWLATTLGNAGGAMIGGLVLLPALGMTRLAALLAGLAALAPLALRRNPARPVVAIGVAAACAFALLPAHQLVYDSFPLGRLDAEGVLAIDEGIDETIVVTGTDGPRRLWTNGHPMSSTLPSARRYMRLIAHVPLLGKPDAKRALVICYGVGNTLDAVVGYPLERIDLADLSAGVLRMAPWFGNEAALQDPRVRVVVDDGRHVLLATEPGALDVVMLEPPPLAHAGVASLYTREFYTLAASRMVDGGWISQWLPAWQVPEDTVRALVGAFVDVFPGAVLLVGADRELILVGVKGGVPRIDGPVSLPDIGIESRDDLARTFAGTHLERIAQGRVMTDDRPEAEWSQVSHVARTRLPDGLVDPAGYEVFVPGVTIVPTTEWGEEGFRSYSNLSE